MNLALGIQRRTDINARTMTVVRSTSVIGQSARDLSLEAEDHSIKDAFGKVPL